MNCIRSHIINDRYIRYAYTVPSRRTVFIIITILRQMYNTYKNTHLDILCIMHNNGEKKNTYI